MKTRRDANINVDAPGWGGGTSVAFHLLYDLEQIKKLEARKVPINILTSTIPGSFDLSTKTPVQVNVSKINKTNLVIAHTSNKDFIGVWADHGNDSFTLYAGTDYITFKSNSEGKIYPSATSITSGSCVFDGILAII